MDIGDRIKELRKSAKVSQADLAKKIGVSSGNVGDWERGRAKPGADALISLMNFFEVSADFLLTGTNHEIVEKKNEEIQSSNDSINLTRAERDLIIKFRQLDHDDQEDAMDIIEMKYNRKVKRGTSSNSTSGGTGEEAAAHEAV